MHARELVDLAAWVATQGPSLIRSPHDIPQVGIEQYWTSAKCRLDRWGRALRQLARPADGPPRRGPAGEPLALLEEVLTGEMLTRVWTAALAAYDRRRRSDLAEPVARSVHIGHLEVRHRVLTLMVRGPGLDAAQAVKLNHLRLRVERWTDVLMGNLAELADVREFAFQPERANDFADDLRRQRARDGGRHAWPLLMASLQAAFSQGLSPISPNADLNAQLAAGVLACFPGELFDSTGLFRSVWLMRLSSITSDAQGLIDDLLAAECGAATAAGTEPSTASCSPLRRFRRR